MAKLIQLSDADGAVYPELYYKTYAVTRIENSYANATAVGRMSLMRYGRTGIIIFNFQPSTSIPANQSDFFKIAKFDCKLTGYFYASIPSQKGSGVLTMYIATDGTIYIINNSATATGVTFFRASVPVIFASDSK